MRESDERGSAGVTGHAEREIGAEGREYPGGDDYTKHRSPAHVRTSSVLAALKVQR